MIVWPKADQKALCFPFKLAVIGQHWVKWSIAWLCSSCGTTSEPLLHVYQCSRKKVGRGLWPKEREGHWMTAGTCLSKGVERCAPAVVQEGTILRRNYSKKELFQEGTIPRRKTSIPAELSEPRVKGLTPDSRGGLGKERDILLIQWA